jgi:hypothetical protein
MFGDTPLTWPDVCLAMFLAGCALVGWALWLLTTNDKDPF